MKIFAGGVATETNTFAQVPTGLEDFQVQRGKDAPQGSVANRSFDLNRNWGDVARKDGHDFVFSLMAWAQPSGITVKSAYDALRDELLDDLRAALPVDIVLLNLHGAMVAQGYDDCEEDVIRRVRALAGSDAVICVELDLHCHLSHSKISLADVVITYKEYPHVDVNERAGELYRLAVATRLGQVKPTMALFDCRMIGIYPTTLEPLRSFVDAMKGAEQRESVLSISFGHGFQFADLPHVGAKVLTVTDNDPQLAQDVAREFGLRVHALRRQIGFERLSLPIEKALSKALACTRRPVVVADQTDNVGGGAPGDATFVLRWLLDHGGTDAAIAILQDPEVVRIAKKAGVGATVNVRLGGKTGAASGQPVDIEVLVLSLRENYQHAWPQSSGEPLTFPVGDVVALRSGGIDIVVGSIRCQCFGPSIFSDLGIDPRNKRLLIPKSYQHFYAAFAPIAQEVIYMAASGAVPPDPRMNTYRRLDTSTLYPWAENPLSADQ